MLLSAASSGVSIVFDGNVDVDVVSVDAVAGTVVDAAAADLRGILYT
jgi:hypothetical protein